MCVYCNMEVLSDNLFWRGKSISVTYSECEPVALVTQHAKRMHYITVSSVACLVLAYFSTLLHKQHSFQEESY